MRAGIRPEPRPNTLLVAVDATHRTFVGKLDPAQLGLGERFIIWNVKRFVRDAAREGDFRDWAAIRAWADEISAALQVPSAVQPESG